MAIRLAEVCALCGSNDHSLSHCPWKGRTMKRIALTLCALALAGCATIDGKLDNRVVCTAAKDRAFVVSEWGPVGISARIHDADRAVICK